MFNLLKNAMHASIGGAALAADKVQEGVQELIKKGQLTEKEGKELVEGYLSKLKSESDKFKTQVQSEVKKQMEKIAIPKKAEFEKLQKEVALLEARVVALESKLEKE